MKLTISRDLLLAGLSAVLPAVPLRPATPVLGNILLSASASSLGLDASDGDIYISRTLAVDAEATGSILVPAAALNQYVKGLPAGGVTLSVEDKLLTVSAGRCKATFNGPMDPTTFPRASAPEGGYDMDADILREAMQSACGFAEDDNNVKQHYTRSVLLRTTEEGLKIVATDGKSLFTRTLEGGADHGDVLIPVTAAKVAVSAFQGERVRVLTRNVGPAYFISDTGFCRVPTADERYPDDHNLRRVMNFENAASVRLAVDPLKTAIQRQLAFVDRDYAPVRFYGEGESLRIEGKQHERGQAVDEVECNAEGDFKFMANLHILSGALAPFSKAGDLQIAVGEPGKGTWPFAARITSPRFPDAVVIVIGLNED